MKTYQMVWVVIQVILYIGALGCCIKSLYHLHQSDRILDRKGKQTFWQWIKRVDTPRGTGIWNERR